MSHTDPNQTVPPPAAGLTRIWKAFFYSMQGLFHGITKEPAFRQEIIMTAVLVPLVLLLPFSVVFKAVLFSANMIVLITELLNSAVEALVDRVCEGYDPFAKIAKDMGSAAVFISLVNLGVMWGFAVFDWLFS